MNNIVPDIDALNDEIDNLSDRFKVRNEQGPKRKDQHKNAFAHAYASAVLRYENNPAYSNFWGTLREYKDFVGGSRKAIQGKKGYTLDGVKTKQLVLNEFEDPRVGVLSFSIPNTKARPGMD